MYEKGKEEGRNEAREEGIKQSNSGRKMYALGKEEERVKIIKTIEILNDESMVVYRINLKEDNDLSNEHASAIAVRNEIINFINK